jgi:hypothetical protein
VRAKAEDAAKEERNLLNEIAASVEEKISDAQNRLEQALQTGLSK